jgi:hypothetical protein
MARFLWDPMLVEFNELFDECEESIPVECLSMDWLTRVRRVLKDVSYRKSDPGGTRVHTFHVHVGSEERYFTALISVRLHTLKKCLGIVQNA